MLKTIRSESGVITEMNNSYGAGNIDVPLASGIDLDQLLDGDSDPLFVTIDALSDTVSENQRRWTTEELHSIAKQVMEKKPDGYRGHLKPDERSHKAPDAVTLWVGAKVANYQGKNRLFIKGYVLPKESGFKDYLRRAKAAGKNIAVSVYGRASEIWSETLKAFEINNFSLESIDWARPGSEGVPNSGFLKLTAEMDEGESREMDKEQALKEATISEMQEFNPNLVQEIEAQGKSELENTISEMTNALGLEDSKDLVKVVGEMKARNSELETQVAHGIVDRILGNKVANVSTRGMIRKMVISEMAETTETAIQETVEKVLNSEEGKTLVGAYTPVVTPAKVDNREKPSGSRFIKK